MRLFVLIFFFLSSSLFGESLDEYKDTCAQIGFKKGTPDFGNCVLKLRKKNALNNTISAPAKSPSRQTLKGDDSQEDVMCQKYGFAVGSTNYNSCRMNLDMAKQNAIQQQKFHEEQVRQYNEQKRIYDEQQAKAKADKDAEDTFNLIMYGLNRAGGKTHDEAAPALYGLPAYPKQPPPVIQQAPIQPIGGTTLECSWDVWRKVYRCN